MMLDINSASMMGYTALHAASRKGHEAVVRILLEAEADVDSLTLAGLTPLMLAASGGHAEVALLLLKKAPDLDATISSARKERAARDFALDFGHQEIATMIDDSAPKKAEFTSLGGRKKSNFTRRAVTFEQESESGSSSTPIRRKSSASSAWAKARDEASKSSISSVSEEADEAT
eukprot:CAMPEP_0172918198 /NCGR_PEP_ID=MMETSP1075-20121228/199704_1 /TAXON_ID=2916 /ORGANISM="Ceratium fusus, Strain PA161109" /LENGTH=174 /DNA_ID=CAMNT_0013777801 /DNA_START=212 /DNA_END=736 /DNA_ORIENTATION=-